MPSWSYFGLGWVGLVRVGCRLYDGYNAISIQWKLLLSTGNELGKSKVFLSTHHTNNKGCFLDEYFAILFHHPRKKKNISNSVSGIKIDKLSRTAYIVQSCNSAAKI